MKFSSALSTLLVVLPIVLVTSPAAAVPAFARSDDGIIARAGGKGKGAAAKPPIASLTAVKSTAAKATGAAKAGAKSAPAAAAVIAASSTAVAKAVASSTGVAAAAASSAAASSADVLQTSLTLDPGQVAVGLAQNGQEVPVVGQVDSLTSTNNFINYCALHPDQPLTNGLQILSGSCNGVIMGQIFSKANQPSQTITFPDNYSVIQSNTSVTFTIAIAKAITGNFVDATSNYFGAPAQLDPATGQIIAHSHITCNEVASFNDKTTANPAVFSFFKGLNDAAVGGVLSATAAGGFAASFQRCCTMGTAANHQPWLGPVAQHASYDDCIRFQVADDVAAAKAALAASITGGAAAAPPASTAAASSGAAAASPPAAASTNAAKATSSSAAAKAKATPAKASPKKAAPKKSSKGRGRGRGRN